MLLAECCFGNFCLSSILMNCTTLRYANAIYYVISLHMGRCWCWPVYLNRPHVRSNSYWFVPYSLAVIIYSLFIFCDLDIHICTCLVYLYIIIYLYSPISKIVDCHVYTEPIHEHFLNTTNIISISI